MYRAIYITSDCRHEENAIAHRQSYGVRMRKRTNMYTRAYLKKLWRSLRIFCGAEDLIFADQFFKTKNFA